MPSTDAIRSAIIAEYMKTPESRAKLAVSAFEPSRLMIERWDHNKTVSPGRLEAIDELLTVMDNVNTAGATLTLDERATFHARLRDLRRVRAEVARQLPSPGAGGVTEPSPLTAWARILKDDLV